jgi:hypothetical protein
MLHACWATKQVQENIKPANLFRQIHKVLNKISEHLNISNVTVSNSKWDETGLRIYALRRKKKETWMGGFF